MCVKLFSNRASGFWQEDFWSLLYSHIGKMSPAPWQPCFVTDQNYLKEFGRGSPKEHLCQIISKSGQWFLTRRFLKFALKLTLFGPLWPLCAMDRNRLNNFERGSPKGHPCEVSSNLSQWFRRRCRLKEKFTDDGRRQTPHHDISTLGTLCPVVLKTWQ